jgi:MoaA/NifB/PqqE/SkfB family radical SAM enzyme
MTLATDRDCCFRRSTLGGIPRVLWELNSTCNLACGFCHASPHTEPGLSTSEIYRMLDILAELGVKEVIFSGGEPLLRKDIFEILHHAQLAGFQLDLCTNATLVTASIARELAGLLAEISVSLDSADPNVHDQLRGRLGSWEKAVHGIQSLVENGLEVHAITLACDQTVPGIEATIQTLTELGVQSVTLLGLMPVMEMDNQFTFSPGMREKLIQSLPGLRKRYPTIVINTKRILATESENACGAGQNIWGITAEGMLIPCILLQHCTQGLSLDDLKDYRSWQEVNDRLKMLNPDPYWKQCTSFYQEGSNS